MVLLLQKYTADYTEENATGHVGASRNKNKQLDELGVVTGMHDGVFGEDNEEEVDQKEENQQGARQCHGYLGGAEELGEGQSFLGDATVGEVFTAQMTTKMNGNNRLISSAARRPLTLGPANLLCWCLFTHSRRQS